MEATSPSEYRPDVRDSGDAACAAESFDRSCARAGLVGRLCVYLVSIKLTTSKRKSTRLYQWPFGLAPKKVARNKQAAPQTHNWR